MRVPLGSKRLIGCFLGETEIKPHFPTKEILEILDGEEPILSGLQLRLLQWASAYYLTPVGEVLRHLLPPRLLHSKEGRKTKERPIKPPSGLEDFTVPQTPSLNAEQEAALRTVRERLEQPKEPILLHGVTGSGKTEVYIAAVREVIHRGGQALILVPEIGLTPQIVGRFQNLGAPTAVYHSALTEAQRFQVWTAAKKGLTGAVIATRSGIFLSFPNLKLIVIDEEHDPSYKQEERFCYHARDLALWRGEEERVPVLLGSATPSLESLYRVEKGKMRLSRLTDRPAGVRHPTLETIDRRGRKKGHPIFSEELLEAIRANLRKGEQTLLFLNRRGFSPFVLCPECGFVPKCSQCEISLTLHGNGLICHYCDGSQPYHSICPQCRRGTMQPEGFGTERIDAELRRLFPSARVARMDRDSTKKGEWLKILERMKRREIDILVGTQMITKGHDYPYLTLVGILDADLSLHLPDFRAAERTFQLITQVAGRAGRSERPGRVLIQTFHPTHESILAAAARDGGEFYSRELRERLEAGYPPFRRLIEIRLAGAKRDSVIETSQKLTRRIVASIQPEEGSILGPAPCLVEKVRGKTRWRLLIKTPHYTKIQPRLRRLLDEFCGNTLPSTVKMLVNVDPVDMM